MKLYHESLEIIGTPEIRIPTRPLDFGNGFYTTTSEAQAKDWVKRRMDAAGAASGFINLYTFNEADVNELKVLKFTEPSHEWIEFVMTNRLRLGFMHDYDVVIGPVANDRVFAAFSLYESGILDEEDLLKQLRVYKLVDQVLFHTEKALQMLCFVSAEEML